MTPTSLGHDLTARDKGNGKDHRSVEQAAADYRRSMKYVEANEEAIMRKWKARAERSALKRARHAELNQHIKETNSCY